MSKVITVKIEGGRELYEQLEQRPLRIAKAIIRKGLKKAAGIWRGEMRQRVAQGWHVWKGSGRTGRSREFAFLRDHIGMKVSVRGDELEGTCAVGPVKKGFWAMFLEFGTSRQPAQGFIRKSFDARGQEVLDKFTQTCREELAKEWPAAK